MTFYRKTTLGIALSEGLDEMIRQEQISEQLATKVLAQFDQSFYSAFEKVPQQQVKFKYKMKLYRFCDFVWTFVLENPSFQIGTESVQCDRLKVVAIDETKVSFS
eukprot:TRINITY_DN9030_c0_g1_i1.p1 TRINITY_DN9030_c0_g1~~TRINITY_DN9030_c0_g1_i1.p1  ORF type:complete len:121 (+),score=30.05 TRINITY_DN9030_c0_g1_i1:51-365(+)